MAEELQCQEQDIIEKLSGATEWVSRIVTAKTQKSPDEIRRVWTCEMQTRQSSEPHMQPRPSVTYELS